MADEAETATTQFAEQVAEQPARSPGGFDLLASLPSDLLTAQMLAQSGESVGRLHAALTAAGVRIDAYTEALAQMHAYVDAHPEQVDVVRLMGGDEHDLVTALMAQWFAAQTTSQAMQTTATQAVTSDGSTPDEPAGQSGKVVSLASRRRQRAAGTRKRTRQPAR